MGQQQLLLVILVTIIVGIATVVAINIFGTAAEQANIDAVRQDMLSAATQVQGVYTRPILMGGAGGDFTNLTATQIADVLNAPGTSNGAVISNENGVYTVQDPSADEVIINAVPESTGDEWVLTVTFDPTTGFWNVQISDGTNTVSQSTNPA